MQSTLFYIPATLLGIPVFGFGWLLAAWALFSAVLLAWLWSRPGGRQEAAGYLPFVAIVAAVIVLVLPNMIFRDPAGRALGVPIRGFGVMLMLATVSSVGLAAYRAWQVGVDPEAIYSLAFVMFIAGIAGARLFFVVQYWREFVVFAGGGGLDLPATVRRMLNFTEGGLVVYGSVLAGLPAGAWFCWKRRLPLLVIADIIAPSMVLGQALGRIGCFLNGCCFGSVCLTASYAVTFPIDSPPYKQQTQAGWQSGVWLDAKQGGIIVDYVAPGSPAQKAGVKAGERIDAINGTVVDDLAAARSALAKGNGAYFVRTTDKREFLWQTPPLPARSVPVHATQIYSAIDAGLLALVLWLAYPFRRRDGEIFALLVTFHPVSRFLLEAIRSDEPGRFGTALTISQWLSIAILVLVIELWVYVELQPRRSEAAVT